MDRTAHTPPRERIDTIDVIRGFALLGILIDNIYYFGYPNDFMESTGPVIPATGPLGERAVEAYSWFHDLFVLGKMMGLFAMLFGAGVFLFSRDTPDARVQPHRLSHRADRWYARCAWLAVFGLAHGVFFWFGDILLAYGLAGLGAVWWVRRWPKPALLAAAVALYATGIAIVLALQAWMSGFESGDPAEVPVSIANQLEAYRGSYLDAMGQRAIMLAFFYIMFLPIMVPTMITAMMILGVAIARFGWFAGACPRWSYVLFAALLPASLVANHFLRDALLAPEGGNATYQMVAQGAGVFTSLGYAACLILLCRCAWFGPVKRCLAAVGRLAFTSYFTQTLLCTTLFYGYGFGLFGHLAIEWAVVVVLGVWIFNIAFARLWLTRFSIGPLEWVWRTLTDATVAVLRRPRHQPAASPEAAAAR